MKYCTVLKNRKLFFVTVFQAGRNRRNLLEYIWLLVLKCCMAHIPILQGALCLYPSHPISGLSFCCAKRAAKENHRHCDSLSLCPPAFYSSKIRRSAPTAVILKITHLFPWGRSAFGFDVDLPFVREMKVFPCIWCYLINSKFSRKGP